MGQLATAQVVLGCDDLDATINFFTERLGFRLDAIMPADDPRLAVLTGHGLRVRLVVGGPAGPGELRLPAPDPTARGTLTAPNGTVVHLVDPDPAMVVPDGSGTFELTRPEQTESGLGRADMFYRDLLPTRQNGRFIASHIRIPGGGPVPDYVHHHRVRFQLIYCAAGWVRVVYQDQGPPFLLEAGDCVLQPPGIRHRVLESSPGLEVIELGCPAEHETFVEHELSLPNDGQTGLRYGGQLFVQHRAAGARWQPWRSSGWECRDTGIAAATDGLAGVRVVRPCDVGVASGPSAAGGEFQFWYVLAGTATLRRVGEEDETLGTGAAVAVPAAMVHQLVDPSGDLAFLEVTLPA